jgi:hypothetical protein
MPKARKGSMDFRSLIFDLRFAIERKGGGRTWAGNECAGPSPIEHQQSQIKHQ